MSPLRRERKSGFPESCFSSIGDIPVSRKNAYLLFCVLGAAIPYSQFVPWVMENALQLGLFVRQLFANRISAFFGLDVLVSSVVLLSFMRAEGRMLRIRFRWMLIAGLCAVG
jgi:hypothetical protein